MTTSVAQTQLKIPRRGAVKRGLWLGLLCVCAAAAAWAAANAHPIEDAALTLRYVLHLGTGAGWRYNIGGPRTDGVSDPAAAIAAAALVRLGIAPFSAMRVVAAAAQVATAGLIAWIGGKEDRLSCVSLAAALIFAFGPGLLYLFIGYATPVFALVAAAAWSLLVTDLSAQDERDGTRFAAAVGALCLSRPEGNILALGFVGAAFALNSRRAARYVAPAIVFILFAELLLAGARIAWFGSLVPLALRRKGGLHWSSLLTSSWYALQFCAPGLLALAAFSWPKSKRLLWATLIPVMLFTVSWALVSMGQNYFGRYQYPLLAISLISACAAAEMVHSGIEVRARNSAWALCLAAVLTGAAYWQARFRLFDVLSRNPDWDWLACEHMAEIGRRLASLAPKGLRMATTEDGILPFYSQWQAMDTWGLNDPRIAEHGVSARLLAEWRPDLIMLNIDRPGVAMPEPDLDAEWLSMCRVLLNYARSRNYRLAALYIDDSNKWVTGADVYYVRRDSLQANAIARAVSRVPEYSIFGMREATRDPKALNELARLSGAARP